MAATIHDIAKRSGYSPATISRVMNGFEGVRHEVREKVEAVARELGYTAKRGRRGPDTPRLVEVILHRRTGMEGIAVDSDGLSVGPLAPASAVATIDQRFPLSNDFYRRIVDGILAELQVHDGKAVLQPSHDFADPALIRGLAEGVEGILVVGEDGPAMGRFLSQCPVPVVLVDIIDTSGTHEQVTSDNFGGIGQAVAHLVDLGHRSLGLIAGPDVPATRERVEAFRYHVQRFGASIPDGWEAFPYQHIAGTAETLAPRLRNGNRPTGICCCNDAGALAVLRAADAVGLRIPQDLSVVGYDDTDSAALVTPPLSSVRTASDALGRMAVRLLMTQGDRPQAGCIVRLPCHLVTRRSSGPAPR